MPHTSLQDLLDQTRDAPLRIETEAQPWLDRHDDPAQTPDADALAERRRDAVADLGRLFDRLESNETVELAELDAIADRLMKLLESQPARFPQLALLSEPQEDYLADHGFAVAVLAMATAVNLRWPREGVRLMARCGLVFDAGMRRVPARIRLGTEPLNETDRACVQRHPIESAAMIGRIEGATPLMQLAALQHHEREDGSGYPQGLRRSRLCDPARVLAAADAYLAATEPRPHRPGKLPYLAMEELLSAAAAMRFWKPAARALSQAVGMFPVGSIVKLSTGQLARVLATNAHQIDRPVVAPLRPDGEPMGYTVNLSDEAAGPIQIVRAMALAA